MNLVFIFIQIIVGFLLFFRANQEKNKIIKIALAFLFALNGYNALSRFCHELDGVQLGAPYISFFSLATVFFLNRNKSSDRLEKI